MAPTPAETFLTARMAFNGLLEDYIIQKRAAPPTTQAKWSQEIDPWFERAAVALKSWQLALKASGDGGDPADERQAYRTL